MAYGANDLKVVVNGRLGATEVWTNSWAVGATEEADGTESLVSAFRGAYIDLQDIMNNQWHADGITLYSLASTTVFHPDWATFAGSNVLAILPTQCAIKVSLSNGFGVRGGPFLSGFDTEHLATDGTLDTDGQDIVLNAVTTLASQLAEHGYLLSIDRPSTSGLATATQVRIGRVFDTIRRRRDARPELYAAEPL